MLRLALPLLAALLVVAAPALADQTDPRLRGLFDRLQRTQSAQAAEGYAQEIWQIWTQYPRDDTINQLMRQSALLMQRQRLDKAVEALDAVVDGAPGFAEGWNRRATVHYMMGNFGRSIADVRQTLTLEPRHFGALSGLGLIYLQLDQPESALKAFEAALKVNPHLPVARVQVQELTEKLKGKAL
jgi:tetratricopeptide (TPR) repeat protein